MTGSGSNLRGIVAISVSNLLFVLSDTLLKLMSAGMPTGEIVFLRGVAVMVIVAVLLIATGQVGALRRAANPLVWLRTAGEITVTLSFIYALFHMPLGNVTVMMQAAPLALTAAAAVFLREPVGWRRWAAILTGLLGVVVVARPGLEGFSAWSLLLIIAVAGVCVRDLTTRLIADTPRLVMIALTGLSSTAAGLVIGLFEDWVPLDLVATAQISGACLALVGAYYAMIMSMHSGEVAVVATFRYTVIPYAIILGYLLWGDVPDLPMILGTLIILAAGLYVLHRERLRLRGLKLAGARGAPEP